MSDERGKPSARPEKPEDEKRKRRREPRVSPPIPVDYAERDKRWPTKPQGED